MCVIFLLNGDKLTMRMEDLTGQVSITQWLVDSVELPRQKCLILRDYPELKGFGLRVTASGGKSYVVEWRIEGRDFLCRVLHRKNAGFME